MENNPCLRATVFSILLWLTRLCPLTGLTLRRLPDRLTRRSQTEIRCHCRHRRQHRRSFCFPYSCLWSTVRKYKVEKFQSRNCLCPGTLLLCHSCVTCSLIIIT